MALERRNDRTGQAISDRTFEIQRLSQILFATWCEEEPDNEVTKYPVSFMHTFNQMAAAIIDSIPTTPVRLQRDALVNIHHHLILRGHETSCRKSDTQPCTCILAQLNLLEEVPHEHEG